MTELITDAELAEDVFKIDVERLHVLRKRYGWPCTRLGRFDIRFTQEQVDQILAIHAETPERPTAAPVRIAGQTAASVARRRRA